MMLIGLMLARCPGPPFRGVVRGSEPGDVLESGTLAGFKNIPRPRGRGHPPYSCHVGYPHLAGGGSLGRAAAAWRVWITNRRVVQNLGTTRILVWATAVAGPCSLVRLRTAFSLSATAVSRFSHDQMQRRERPSIRLDVTGTGRPNRNTLWRKV